MIILKKILKKIKVLGFLCIVLVSQVKSAVMIAENIPLTEGSTIYMNDGFIKDVSEIQSIKFKVNGRYISEDRIAIENLSVSSSVIKIELNQLKNDVINSTNTIQLEIYTLGEDTGTLKTNIYNLQIGLDNEITDTNNDFNSVGVSTGFIREDLITEIANRLNRDDVLGVDTGTLRTDLIIEISQTDTNFIIDRASITMNTDDITILKNSITDIHDNYATDAEVLSATISLVGFFADYDNIQTDTTTLRTDLNSEILSTNSDFDNVATDTITLQTNIDNEETDRIDADNAIGVDTTTLRIDLTTETNNRIGDDFALGVSTGTIYVALQSTGVALSDEITRAVARENNIAISTGTNASNIYDLQISTGENKDRIVMLEYSTAVLCGQIDSLQGQITMNDDVIETLGVSTGAIYNALKSTGAALSAEIVATNADFTVVDSSLTDIHNNYARINSTTEWTGENTFSAIKLKSENYATEFKAGSQSSNIFYTSPTSTDGAEGYGLRLSSSGQLSWQPLPIAGSQNYFFTTDISDVLGYVMYSSQTLTGGVTTQVTVDAADVVIGTWTTPSGYPFNGFIPEGLSRITVWAKKLSGAKDARFYGKMYIRKSGGELEYIGQSTLSGIIIGSIERYRPEYSGDLVELEDGDRYVMVGCARQEGSGTNPVIDVYLGPEYPGNITLPASEVDVHNYTTKAEFNVEVAETDAEITAIGVSTGTLLTKSSATVTYLEKTNKAADSDLLDGYGYDAFAQLAATQTFTGENTFENKMFVYGNIEGDNIIIDADEVKIQDGNLNMDGNPIIWIDWMNSDKDFEDSLLTNISTTPANSGDASTKGYTDYAVKMATNNLDGYLLTKSSATATYQNKNQMTDYAKTNSSPTWTGEQTFGKVAIISVYDTNGSSRIIVAPTVQIIGTASSNTVDTGAVYINNLNATVNRTILGLAKQGVLMFRVDNEGDVTVVKDLSVGGAIIVSGSTTSDIRVDGGDIFKDGAVQGTHGYIYLGSHSTVNGTTTTVRGDLRVNGNDILDRSGNVVMTFDGTGKVSQITWSDGTVQMSSPTVGGGGAGGEPDISFNYNGDIFNSTASHINGLSRVISKYELNVASFDVYIGSATTDSFSIQFSTATLGEPWAIAETITVPAGVNKYEVATGENITIADGGLINYGFTGADSENPAGDITIRISD